MLIAFLYCAVAYLFGGFSPGYWLVKIRTGKDIRTQGSGSTGATNVGRVLGKLGFATVFIGDILKGALVVGLAKYFNLHIGIQCLAALAVIAGHIWPAQLHFRGGRGISPLIGCWFMLAPLALAPCLLLAFCCLVVLRRFTISGLCGLLALPPAAYWASYGHWTVTATGALSLILVLISHRDHLRKELLPEPKGNPRSAKHQGQA